MAASRPTRPLLQEIRVIDVSNENMAWHLLFLKMAFQTKRRVAFGQQPLIDGAVRRMADSATLTHRFVLIHPRAALLRVALKAGFVFAQESEAAGFERLLNICRCAVNRDPFVRLVTIGAAHFAFGHWMVMRQLELCAHFQVTLETSVRRFPRIDDCVRRTAALYMQTSRPVARFAPHVFGVLALRLQPRVSGCSEITRDGLVAGRAFL
jgi:hypothetical protein